MDTTASLIAIVTLAYKITKYLGDVREGGKERSDVYSEVLTIQDIFMGLQCDLESQDVNDESDWSRALKPLFKPDGAVQQLKGVLEEFAAKIVLPRHKANSITRKLKWPFDKAETQRVIGRLRSLRDTISSALGRANLAIGLDTNTDLKFVRDRIETAELEIDLHWLSPLDFRMLQKSPDKQALEGTGRWFLDSPQVRGWCTLRTSALYCSGIMGAGKSILATSLYQSLQKEYAGHQNVAVLIACCTFDDANTHTVDNLLCSFARQLVELRGDMSEALQNLFIERTKAVEKGRPTGEALIEILSKELASFDSTFIIVDGLDELPQQSQQKLLQSIESMNPLPQLLVMSRPLTSIETWFRASTERKKYSVMDGGNMSERSSYDCDNCDHATLWDESSQADTAIFTTETETVQESGGPEGLVKNGDGRSIEGSYGTQVSDEWRTAASYQCEHCERKICVDCYDKYDVCFGCNNQKSCFKWVWPSLITINADRQDLERYIIWRIDTSHSLQTLIKNSQTKIRDLRGQIVSRVQREANKMFLLAKFHMNALEEQINVRGLLNTLENLPSNVNDIYDKVFSRIENQRLAPVLAKLLTVVATSRKLLSAKAVAHAIVVRPGDRHIDELEIPDTSALASLCGGLVQIDYFGFVRVTHETIGRYIAETGLQKFKIHSGHEVLAEICLSYLQLVELRTGAFMDSERERLIEARRKQYPLLSYAATYWGYHAHHAQNHTSLSAKLHSLGQLTLAFLMNEKLVASAVQFMWLDDMETSSGWDVEEGVHGLHLSAHLHLTKAVSGLLDSGVQADVEDCLQTTPLMYAAKAGHADVVLMLLRAGADPSRICARLHTALHRACINGHANVVEQLISFTGDIAVNAFDELNRTAIMWSVLKRNSEILRLLLTRHDIDLELKTPNLSKHNFLHLAISCNDPDATRELLRDGRVSIESTDSSVRTSLHLAVIQNLGHIVTLLLEHGADMSAKDIFGGPPLLRAVDNNAQECVRLLLSKGADCHFQDLHGRGLLHGCAINNRVMIMRFLLERGFGLDPNLQDDEGQTPMHDAVGQYSDVMVKVLLEHGVRTDLQNSEGKTPLRLARDLDAHRIYERLREARLKEMEAAGTTSSIGAQRTTSEFRQPQRRGTMSLGDTIDIDVAVRKFNSVQLKTYLDECGADVDEIIQDPSSQLLHTAARYGLLDNIKVLVERNASVNAKDSFRRTPLIMSIHHNHFPTTEYLPQHKCNVNDRDALERSALDITVERSSDSAFAFILLKHGATFKLIRDRLYPVLVDAIDKNELQVVKLLVHGGVPVHIRDRRGYTLYQRAKKAGYGEIAQYLYEKSRQDRSKGPDSVSSNAATETSKFEATSVVNQEDMLEKAQESHNPPELDGFRRGAFWRGKRWRFENAFPSAASSDALSRQVSMRELTLMLIIAFLLTIIWYK